MRWDELRRANDVAQPVAEFAQLRAVLDLDEDGPERFQLRTSCSPPPALLTTGRPRVKCASSNASAQPAAIAFSLSSSKLSQGIKTPH
jgi:hypothetical protein